MKLYDDDNAENESTDPNLIFIKTREKTKLKTLGFIQQIKYIIRYFVPDQNKSI